MTVTINGTTGVSLCAASSVPSTALQSGVPSRSQLPAGTVLQVVQGSTSTQASTSSSTYTASNLTASITPTAATSKILIIYNTVVYCDTATGEPHTTLARNGSLLNSSGGLSDVFNSAGRVIANGVGLFLDSPATTSSTTYTVYFKVDTAGVAYTPASGTQAVIILMEIAA